MIRLDLVQGSPEWKAARVGIPTASQFHRILTPKTCKVSASAPGYRNELLAEWLLGEPLDEARSQFMERGSAIEADARLYYECVREVQVERVGFILRDDRMVGCSPDGLVGADGGVELKCLGAAGHIGALLGDADEHKCQVQGGMWLANRKWWDLVFYHPVWPSRVIRYERDDEFIVKLSGAVDEFVDDLLVCRVRLVELGCKPTKPAEPNATEQAEWDEACSRQAEVEAVRWKEINAVAAMAAGAKA